MRIAIIIPAHNEAQFLPKTLDSLISQTLQPKRIIIVNDGSTDETLQIAQRYAEDNFFITAIDKDGDQDHSPGGKVIKTFNFGLEQLDENYDILCKFDADLIFPEDYLQKIAEAFKENSEVGMAGGFCSIFRNNNWIPENLTNSDHIRGALKAYRKKCFQDIGGLKEAMGWDTADELLARYHDWKVVTLPELHVKHLRPTGKTYQSGSGKKQGHAFYRLRYGFVLTMIASMKLALKKKKPVLFLDYMIGFTNGFLKKMPFLVSAEEGKFIRDYRWQKISEKLF